MMMFEEFQDRVGELITGIIQQSDNRYTLVQLRDNVELRAVAEHLEQIYSERYDHGMRVKAVITDVSAEGKGPRAWSSRGKSPELIKKLFALEVPRDRRRARRGGRVVAPRAPDSAPRSPSSSPTPTGSTRSAPASGLAARGFEWSYPSCAARRSTSFPTTRSPLASSPRPFRRARVREVLVDDEARQATVDRARRPALAGDRAARGQNARLAAKLTGMARRHRR